LPLGCLQGGEARPAPVSARLGVVPMEVFWSNGALAALHTERIFIELKTSDRKLNASREGSEGRIYGT